MPASFIHALNSSPRRSPARELTSESNCCDHARRTSDALSGDLKSCSMIRTGSRKRQSQRDVYALIESVEFQRNQTLIVIHAENSIKFTLDDSVEKRVG
jgi:hypothetical protein